LVLKREENDAAAGTRQARRRRFSDDCGLHVGYPIAMPRTPSRAARTAASVDSISREHDGAVQSLLRAMALLEILSEDDEGYRLVDLAARAGLSTSTTHRLLTTLEQKQFVHSIATRACGSSAFAVFPSDQRSRAGAISRRSRCR
jgi:2-hydroxychromene-2-carboxylate isomerase